MTTTAIELNRLAHYIWQHRNPEQGDWDSDNRAAKILASRLGPYMSILAALQPESLVEMLQGACRRQQRDPATTTFLLAARDGADTFAIQSIVEAVLRSRYNGIHPEVDIWAQERNFLDLCQDYLSNEYSLALPASEELPAWGAAMKLSAAPFFQDGCVAFLDAAQQAGGLVTAALLRQECAIWNEARQLPWNRCIHPRIGIARGAAAAVKCLKQAWRNEIVVEESTIPLAGSCRQYAIATGVRFLRSQ